MLYAVLTHTARVVGSGDVVEPTGATLSAETITRLGLHHGQTLLL